MTTRKKIRRYHCGSCSYSTRWDLDLYEHLAKTGHEKADQ